MRNFLGSMPLAAAAFAIVLFSIPVTAQETPQIQLSEQQVQGFLAAQKEILAVTANKSADKPDPQLQAQIVGIAKKHGFSSFDEFAGVADNIALIMSGIDPKTKEFNEPKIAIQKDIDEVKADKNMSPEEKKQALQELEEALKTAQPIKYPGNVDVVKKHYDELNATMQ